MDNLKIAFIGGGNMGEAILASVLDRELSVPEAVFISDINEDRCQYLEQKYNVIALNNNQLAVQKGDVVVLAIKPQNLADVMVELRDKFNTEQLVLSIIAGANIDTIRNGFNHNAVVRAMPNTPAQIGEGIAVWLSTPEVNEQQKELAGAILGAMGKEIYVNDEKYIDMATAVSGSGPAYFFLFMESLAEAAVHIGLPENIAQELVFETMLGSSHFAQKSGKSLAELRRMVTSPGGTTAAALAKLEGGGFSELVGEAVNAAYNKAKELGS
ncbi:MAG: pyrroline-5-carboxylate reductase [Dehalococcoidales bacterium]|nr:pyrroline-5-carboxylate reductase [Dehalococcoidales bacterium]